jgi:CSLREA domain-containing protein
MVKLWDTATGLQVLTLRARNAVYDLAFHPNGERLLSTSSAAADGDLFAWDAPGWFEACGRVPDFEVADRDETGSANAPRSALTGATITVNSTKDPGDGVADTRECTLREAINLANNTPGANQIEFKIPGPGPHIIFPCTELPEITDPLLIDGTTQPGVRGEQIIELVGSSLPIEPRANGLTITASNCTIRGLVINSFSGNGITMKGDQNIIEGNYLGTDVTGTSGPGNALCGISIWGGKFNRVGTNGDGHDDLAERNVISGNNWIGVQIVGPGSDNIVAGNLIGLDITGKVALGGERGVCLSHGARSNRIGSNLDGIADAEEANVISGNSGHGVQIFSVEGWPGSDENIIAGNLIGTDITGTVAVANGNDGIRVSKRGSSNTIRQNVVAGNSGTAIRIGPESNGNVVVGNLIGTDATGHAALGNGGFGVALHGGARSNRVGVDPEQPVTTDVNVICSNKLHGLAIMGEGTAWNVVAGNVIGTDRSGKADLGNAQHGVMIGNAANNNMIGGKSSGTPNTIAFNGQQAILQESGVVNTILENSIFSNRGQVPLPQ